MRDVVSFVLAVLFGLVLSRSGAADYDYIQKMFLFEDFQLYGIIGTAVAVVAPGLVVLRRHGKLLGGGPLKVKPKAAHRGNVIGGILFGVGWSMTGMCPGPILVNLGEGKLYAWAALAGTLAGAYGLGRIYPRIASALRMPQLSSEP
jgi:uncharacterized membrane protein YedE/YeeE